MASLPLPLPGDTPPPESSPPAPKSSSKPPESSPPPPSESSPPPSESSPPPPKSSSKPPKSSPPPPSESSPPPSESSPPPPDSSPPPPKSSPPPPESSPSPPPPPESPPSPPPSSPPSPPNAPPPSTSSPPPPPENSPPPEAPPPPPVDPPPPPPAASPSPPPPPDAKPPKNSHHPPPPPPPSPPPPAGAPPPTTTPPPLPTPLPPPIRSPKLPPSVPPTPPLNNSNVNGSNVLYPPASSPAPKPAAKPTSKTTQIRPNETTNATSGESGGLRGGTTVALGSVVGFLALGLVFLAVWFTHRRKKRKNRFKLNYAIPSPFASSQNSESSFLRTQHSAQLAGSPSTNNFMYSSDGGMGGSRSWFTYEELSTATNGFKSILGEGGFGSVYKGILVDGREVAVKQLKAGSGQGEREFRAEVEIISRIHHRHLVSLVGYCISDHQRLLVYDYVANDTLHHHLYDNEKSLDWASRVKVAAGAARGLAYLHEDCQPRIIHRDIKSTNILLDNNFEARVADFGLAKLAGELDLHTHVSTRVMGTFGYLSPEYASTGKLTEKSDVFSFGVVLLELITGRRPVDASQPMGDESLVEWARPLLTQALETEDFGELVDPRLENNFIVSEMFRMIEAAAACVRHLASKRPRMSQVVRALDSMDEMADLNNGIKPGQSGIFTSREHSTQMKMFQKMAFGSQDYSSEQYNTSQSWRTNL